MTSDGWRNFFGCSALAVLDATQMGSTRLGNSVLHNLGIVARLFVILRVM